MYVLETCWENGCVSCVGAMRGGFVPDPLCVRVRLVKKKEREMLDGCQTAGGAGALPRVSV